jgi:hypothetical protein
MRPALNAFRLLPVFLVGLQTSCRHGAVKISPNQAPAYTADGRMPLPQLDGRLTSLGADGRWRLDTVYAYPADESLTIKALHTRRAGKALWILAGIHGEEPAGPNAIARSLKSISALADKGVPIVLIAMCNPKAYRSNWRYPNTPERDWKKGGYSVGDAEYLLPDLNAGRAPRVALPVGPEAQALTAYALRLSEPYPPLLVLDLHEDELSTEGGYIYSQGKAPKDSPGGAEIIRLLQASGIPIRLSGKTRFGEPVENGMVSRDERGLPIRDGSIDELFASTRIFVNGKIIPGPSAQTVIVVETPAFSGSNLAKRVDAHSAVLNRIEDIWTLSQ